uniref:Uncharacterized protein n=1 Tax=Rhizophora mucronata TaxID=61149 RepID=A0A2P2PTY0_RHIMU
MASQNRANHTKIYVHIIVNFYIEVSIPHSNSC